MISTIKLTDAERHYFSEAVEASFRVSNRHQFFVWTQSAFQGLLPHEILICGVEDGSHRGMDMHRFSSTRYFREEHFEILSEPQTGLVPRLMSVVERTRQPVVLCCASTIPESNPDLHALVSSNELKNLAACLITGPRRRIEAFYAFSRVACPLDLRTSYLLELLTPHLHTTFIRVLSGEREATNPNNQRTGRVVTPREQQILHLIKDGKTNLEIAVTLQVSPWTIKNHVHTIFRKLNTGTRTQAISKAITLGILHTD